MGACILPCATAAIGPRPRGSSPRHGCSPSARCSSPCARMLMEDENGNETSLRHDDGLLYERDINEGDLVTMDGQHQLWKL